MNKQLKRADILSKIDGKLGMIKVLKNEIKDLVQQIEGEWVIRKRWVREHKWHGGSISEGFCRYYAVPGGGINPAFHSTDINAEYVKTSKSPRDMQFLAECLAGEDRKYETQDKYVIEVVDRLDGEVFVTIINAWRFKENIV